jgi:hypothetical protein
MFINKMMMESMAEDMLSKALYAHSMNLKYDGKTSGFTLLMQGLQMS